MGESGEEDEPGFGEATWARGGHRRRQGAHPCRETLLHWDSGDTMLWPGQVSGQRPCFRKDLLPAHSLPPAHTATTQGSKGRSTHAQASLSPPPRIPAPLSPSARHPELDGWLWLQRQHGTPRVAALPTPAPKEDVAPAPPGERGMGAREGRA